MNPYDRVWDPRVDMSAPLRWRKAYRVMLPDLFAPEFDNEHIDQAFAGMLACEVLGRVCSHVFMLQTEHADRMAEYFAADPGALVRRWAEAGDGRIILDNADMYFSELIYGRVSRLWDERGCAASEHKAWGYPQNVFPLRQLWVGVKVTTQRQADVRIQVLWRVPAAVRWVNCEPMIEAISLEEARCSCCHPEWLAPSDGISWVVLGGESGPKARPFDLSWARSIITQCRDTGVPVFVKQLGRLPVVDLQRIVLRNRAGANQEEWPADLRVREWPATEVRR